MKMSFYLIINIFQYFNSNFTISAIYEMTVTVGNFRRPQKTISKGSKCKLIKKWYKIYPSIPDIMVKHYNFSYRQIGPTYDDIIPCIHGGKSLDNFLNSSLLSLLPHSCSCLPFSCISLGLTELTHWPLGDMGIILKEQFSNLLH